ncbi:Uncharacterised protein [Staphylococcus carnosus]|uniref:Uncharacterized protein n=1 Tax=Staphylococcus carnosus TaxID=1281 RepID=A0AAJ0JQ45_STACA|nr:hypothetical protein BEK99_00310 [Staphylococcus carnosus]KKB25746.1 hypothetical protein VV61_03955 [Staphylococcus carnosus]KOR13160.1 hypothetical protein AMC75_07935 [Staphylococcus carnosus]POA02881.1 hypothetical protein CD153_05615 [Staphylococcus carnosus]UTB77327.1 hypothetical protein A2I62_01530 [Staphylococcus carnosus]
MKSSKLWVSYVGIVILVITLILSILSLFNIVALPQGFTGLLNGLILVILYFVMFRESKTLGKVILIIGILDIVLGVTNLLI